MDERTQWHAWTNVALGVWLLTSPLTFSYSEARGFMAWNSFLFGIAVTVAGLWRLSQESRQDERVSLVLGAWVVVSPVLLGFANDSLVLWNHFMVGVTVMANSLWQMQWAAAAHSGPPRCFF